MRIMDFSFSEGNVKMGYIGSFSVLPGVTCAEGVPCGKDCYAKRMVRLYPNVRKAYTDNTNALMEEKRYDDFIEAATIFIKAHGYRLFRFNVSGDFFSYEYLTACCEIAKKNKGVKFLAFTKQFDIATKAALDGIVPKNFNIVYSCWNEFMPEHANLLPAAYFDDGEHKELIPSTAKPCKGNCMECKKCFKLKSGESVVFKKH